MPPQRVVERLAECSVCFEPLAGAPVVLCASRGVSCGHYLHETCARRWRQRESRCPVCRSPFDGIDRFPAIDDPRAWFAAVDCDRSGTLSQREVVAALKATVPGLDVERFDRDILGLWRRWDLNNDGTIDFNELFKEPDGLLAYARAAFRGGPRVDGEPPPLRDGAAWFRFWDYDGSGTLDMAEVHRALVKTFAISDDHGRLNTMAETLSAVWGVFDADGNGFLDRGEFRRCLQSTELKLSKEEVAILMNAADADQNKKVDYAEFIEFAYNILLHLARERALKKLEEGA